MTKELIGHTEYKSYRVQQHINYQAVFEPFLKKEQFTHILEIGTANGGLTLYLKDCVPNCNILSVDIADKPHFNTLRGHGIDIIVRQIFDSNIFNTVTPAKIIDSYVLDFLSNATKKLILCDGGNKINEFNSMASFLKEGDVIMAHDYIESKEVFEKDYKDKIWNWHEVEYKDLKQACEQYQLQPYNKEAFESILWICMKK